MGINLCGWGWVRHYFGWVGVGGALFWVGGGGWGIILGGWGWMGMNRGECGWVGLTVIFFVVLIIFAMLTKYYKLSIFTFLEIVDIYYCGSLF